jgi:hypothetical protein
MARWEPRTIRETMKASLDRLRKRIAAKQAEIQKLEGEAKQVEEALKALK